VNAYVRSRPKRWSAIVRPVVIAVALVDTVFEPRLTQVRVFPPESPYPHALVPAAEAAWEEVNPNELPATTDSPTISLASLCAIPRTLFQSPVVTSGGGSLPSCLRH
jgi:hypothetical protein